MEESNKAKADESGHDEEEEEEKGEENAREVGNGHVGTSNTSNDGTAASREDPVDEENEGIGEDEGREDSPVSSGSNTSKNEDDQEKAKEGTSNTSNDGTAASREDSVDEEDEDREDLPVSSGSNTEKNEEDQTKAKEGGNHSSNTTKKPKKMAERKRKQHDIGKSTTVKTPTEMRGRRRMPSRTAIAFVVDKPLFREESEMLCQHIQEKHNNEVVFTVGGTVMTGAELVKCRDDAESSLNIVDAFIECLKCDDKKNGFEKKRIILQRQHQLEEEVVQVIMKEIGSSKKKGANIEQRFLFCPMIQEQECIVLFVDTSIKDQIVAFLSNDTKISSGQIKTIGKSFAEKVEKAFQTCGYVSPFPNSSNVRVSTVSLEACYSDSSFASMLCIEEYDGKVMPKNFRNPDKAKEEKAWFLGNLLIHEKNTALPEEIREMVRSGVFKKQKRH